MTKDEETTNEKRTNLPELGRQRQVLANTLGKALSALGRAQIEVDEVGRQIEKALVDAEEWPTWWFELDGLPSRISGVMSSIEVVMEVLASDDIGAPSDAG